MAMRVEARSVSKGIIVKYQDRDVRPLLPRIIEELQPPSVCGLSLINCRLTDVEAKILASALRHLKHVREIDLSDNLLSSIGIARLFDLIDREPHIKRSFLLKGNKPESQASTLGIAKMIARSSEKVALVLQAKMEEKEEIEEKAEVEMDAHEDQLEHEEESGFRLVRMR